MHLKTRVYSKATQNKLFELTWPQNIMVGTAGDNLSKEFLIASARGLYCVVAWQSY